MLQNSVKHWDECCGFGERWEPKAEGFGVVYAPAVRFSHFLSTSRRPHPTPTMSDVTKFSARLEPFLLMGKGAKGAAAAKLVQDATSAPGVFVFGELLELDGVKGLETSHANVYELISLFAYGTFEDYKGASCQVPPHARS